MPAIDVFKVAMLSRKFKMTVLDIYDPLTFSHFGRFEDLLRCLSTFRFGPDFSKLKTLNERNKKLVHGY